MPQKQQTNSDNLKRGLAFAYRVGDYFENSVSDMIANTHLGVAKLGDNEEPSINTWYRVDIPKGLTGDGSEYYIYIKKGSPKNLLIFLSGGGVAWNSYTAARPSSGGTITAGMPNFYWSNLRPFTQIMNIRSGITEDINPRNKFKNFSQVIITYATGDLHVGNNDYEFKNSEGADDVIHFHGYTNFRSAMEMVKKYFKTPKKLLIAGDSAGAFAVPALAGEIVDDYYPKCEDITVLSDSGQFLYDGWRDTARDIWKAPDELWQAITSDNITVDWYRRLYNKYGDRFRYLYSSSTHDYLLSAYYNDVANKIFASDKDIQAEFYEQLKVMLTQLRQINPEFHFYINNFKNKMVMKSGMKGGTIHTNIRNLNFHLPNAEGVSMEKWLYDALHDRCYDSGMSLVE